jgi:hypothetical protein
MSNALLFYAVIGPATVVAGFIRGFTGFGGPLFLLPILNFFVPPAVGAGIGIWVDVFANIRLVPDARHDSSSAVVVPLVVGSLVAMPVGAYFLVNGDPRLMKQAIGATILVAALVLAAGWRYRGDIGTRAYGVVGLVSGLVMGATSIGALPALFLSGGRHTARENRANFIIWVFFAEILFLALVSSGGALGRSDVITIVLLVPAYLVGTYLGIRFHLRASEVTVRRAVLTLIVLVALASMVG